MTNTNEMKLAGITKLRKYYFTADGKMFLENLTTGELTEHVPGCNTQGYPMIRMGKKLYYVHRIVAELFIGRIPVGMQVDHIDCDKSNFRADNLRIVSAQTNMRHAFSTGTIATRKLTYEQAEDVRKAYADGLFTQTELAEMYGVVPQTISKIVRNISYQYS